MKAVYATLLTASIAFVAVAPTKNPGLYAGDSLAVGYSMQARGAVNVARTSSGLINIKFHDIPMSIKKACQNVDFRYHYVAISVGANDAKPIGLSQIGSQSWEYKYSLLLDDLLDAAHSCGTKIVLVLPPAFTGKLESDMMIIRELVRSKCSQEVLCVDPAQVFGSSSFEAHSNGIKVRANDRVHMTQNGYQMVYKKIVETVYENTK